jgi:hypothetical protein
MLPYNILKDYIPIRTELRFRIEQGIGIVNSYNNYNLLFLNSTALLIFTLIDNIKSIQQICECFVEYVDIDMVTIQNDIVDVIRYLQWNHIIKLKSI